MTFPILASLLSDWSSYYHFNYSGYRWRLLRDGRRWRSPSFSIASWPCYDSTVDIFTFYVPHRHVYGEQWIKFMKDGVNATPLPTVNTTGYIDHARSEERFSRNAETDLVCRLLLEKKKARAPKAREIRVGAQDRKSTRLN